jgi:hypothetical protein
MEELFGYRIVIDQIEPYGSSSFATILSRERCVRPDTARLTHTLHASPVGVRLIGIWPQSESGTFAIVTLSVLWMTWNIREGISKACGLLGSTSRPEIRWKSNFSLDRWSDDRRIWTCSLLRACMSVRISVSFPWCEQNSVFVRARYKHVRTQKQDYESSYTRIPWRRTWS